ncbi:MAG TPA: hypothetical protein VMT86_16350 [Bryobacteraceae bacterium]|nr:hypothetical protein [Bryobacteraceae bacterium]
MNLTATLPFVLLAAASSSAQTLVIGLYDYASLSAKETVRLTETAGLALADSGIQVVWVHCRGALAVTPAAACETELQSNQIVMRLDAGGLPSSNGGRVEHLGRTLATADGGQFASVSVPAVRTQAAEFGMPFDLLLGYAVAHEAGHCLLGPGHSNSGLMRAAWNRKDAEEMSQRSLHLTKQEARKATARLALAEPVVKLRR